MKGIVITPDLELSIRDFGGELHESIGEAVGGLIEVVHPMGMKPPFCMVVNEEGLLRDLPLNPIGSLWYGTQFHGQSIVGTIVVLKEEFCAGNREFIGLSDAELESAMAELKRIVRPVEMMKGAKK